MENQSILIDIPKRATQALFLVIKAALVAILLFGLIVDGASAGAGYLQAKSAARSTAEYGAVLVEQGIEGPLSTVLLGHVEERGAALVSYRILYKNKRPDRIWVQARTMTRLHFLGLFGIEQVTLVASGKASLPVNLPYSYDRGD